MVLWGSELVPAQTSQEPYGCSTMDVVSQMSVLPGLPSMDKSPCLLYMQGSEPQTECQWEMTQVPGSDFIFQQALSS